MAGECRNFLRRRWGIDWIRVCYWFAKWHNRTSLDRQEYYPLNQVKITRNVHEPLDGIQRRRIGSNDSSLALYLEPLYISNASALSYQRTGTLTRDTDIWVHQADEVLKCDRNELFRLKLNVGWTRSRILLCIRADLRLDLELCGLDISQPSLLDFGT